MSDEREYGTFDRDLIIRRILVALDASSHSQAALEAAAELAARFRAELLGLFVEDINLLRLTELPFAREVGLFSARRRHLDVRDLERQLRAQANRARRSLTAIAERARLQWSFRVTRGLIASELLAAAAEADLVILGRAGWSPTRRRGLGSTAREIAHQTPSLTLLLHESTCLGAPVLVTYDGSASAQRALVVAAALSAQEQDILTVILIDGTERAEKLRQEAAQRLAVPRTQTRYLVLGASKVSTLARLVHMEGCGTLVLPARSSLIQDRALLDLLDEIEIPVLLVR